MSVNHFIPAREFSPQGENFSTLWWVTILPQGENFAPSVKVPIHSSHHTENLYQSIPAEILSKMYIYVQQSDNIRFCLIADLYLGRTFQYCAVLSAWGIVQRSCAMSPLEK